MSKLKLSDKTETMTVCSGRKSWSLSSSFPESMTTGSASFCSLSDSVRNIGVTLDCHLATKTDISSLVRSANCERRRISPIRHLLPINATRILVPAFVLSCLDYCYSLLSGCPHYLLNKLASLHWLPSDSQIHYKLVFLCYNCLNSTVPGYLTELKVYKPALLLILQFFFSFFFSFFSLLCALYSLSQRSFFCFRDPSGTVSLAKLDHQTHSHL